MQFEYRAKKGSTTQTTTTKKNNIDTMKMNLDNTTKNPSSGATKDNPVAPLVASPPVTEAPKKKRFLVVKKQDGTIINPRTSHIPKIEQKPPPVVSSEPVVVHLPEVGKVQAPAQAQAQTPVQTQTFTDPNNNVYVRLMTDMKQKMSNELSQQSTQYEQQMKKLKDEETSKMRELQEFTKQQELSRQKEFREFAETQKQLWSQQTRDLEEKYQKTIDEKQSAFQMQKDAWLEEQERKHQELKKQWLEEQEKKHEELKKQWMEEQDRKQQELKKQWMDEQDRKQQELKQQWTEEQQQQQQQQLQQMESKYVREQELEPVLEKVISQVICKTMEKAENPGSTPTAADTATFEQMIGTTIEKLVKRILETELEMAAANTDSGDSLCSEEPVQYDNVYDDIDIDPESIQTIRKAVIQNHIVNPLYNKKERGYIVGNSQRETITPDNYHASVEMTNIYNDDQIQYFDNALRSKLHNSKRWFTYGSGVQKDVITYVVVDSQSKNIYIGGLFKTVNMCLVQNVAMFQYDKKEWDNMNGGVDNMATCLLKHDHFVFVGGVFSHAGNGVRTPHIAKYHLRSKTWSSLGNGLDSECCALCFDPKTEKLYAGGTFTKSGTTNLGYVGIYNTQTDQWEQLVGNGLNAPCRSLFLDVSLRQLFAGGLFTSADGVPQTSHIARYDLEHPSWNALGQGLQGYCNSIVVHKQWLYAGGTFNCVGNNIAQYDFKTGTWSGLREGVNGICNTVCVNTRGQVFVGGSFTSENENDTVLNRIGMYDPMLSQWMPLENHYKMQNGNTEVGMEEYETGLDSVCKALAVSEEAMYVVGSFQKAGNVDAGCIAKYKM